jgi:RsiW-degrading membrane proteinase PrsW (M82 family)/heme/copper-type cytochrome/quinol oxidase subunit 2
MRALWFVLLFLCPIVAWAGEKENYGMWRLYTYLFWIVFFFLCYLHFLYKRAKSKKEFLRSSLVQAFFVPILMLISAYTIVQLLGLPKPEVTKEPDPWEDMKALEAEYKKKLDADFLNIENTYHYIRTYYYNRSGEAQHYELLNLYADRTYSSDIRYRSVGYLGLAYCYLKQKELDRAQEAIDKIEAQPLKLKDYIQGWIFLYRQDTTQAIAFFKKEIHDPKGIRMAALPILIELYREQKNDKELYTLYQHYRAEVETILSGYAIMKICFANYDYGQYFFLVWKNMFAGTSWVGIVSALLIAFVWAWYLYKVDVFEKDNKKYLLVTFLYGGLLSILAFPMALFTESYLGFSLNGNPLNDLAYCIFGIGLREEILKAIPLLMVLYFSQEINEPYDYVLYACIGALGFSFVENIMYLQAGTFDIIHARALFASIGHLCDSAYVAYGFVLARYRYKQKNIVPILLAALLFASVMHGIYDFLAIQNSAFLFNLFFYVQVSLFIIIINNCLNNSSFFTYQVKTKDWRLDSFLAISLTGIMILQYFVNTINYGSKMATEAFYSFFLSGGFMVLFFIYKLSRLDLVEGFWFGYYRNVYNKYNTTPMMLAPVHVLLGNSIRPNNFVGKRIRFRADRHNKQLGFLNKKNVPSLIYDRWVLPIRSANKKLLKDPYWFMIEFSVPLNFQEGVFNFGVLRFKDNVPALERESDLEAFLLLIPWEKEKDTEKLTVNDLIYKGKILVNLVQEE